MTGNRKYNPVPPIPFEKSIPPQAFYNELDSLSLVEQMTVREAALSLALGIKAANPRIPVGQATGLQILWALGRLLNREANEQTNLPPTG